MLWQKNQHQNCSQNDLQLFKQMHSCSQSLSIFGFLSFDECNTNVDFLVIVFDEKWYGKLKRWFCIFLRVSHDIFFGNCHWPNAISHMSKIKCCAVWRNIEVDIFVSISIWIALGSCLFGSCLLLSFFQLLFVLPFHVVFSDIESRNFLDEKMFVFQIER